MADPGRQVEIAVRKQAAGRIGFGMGCIAATVAIVINLVRAPRPISFAMVLLVVLVALLNVPVGIALGLLGERMSRRTSEEGD